MTRWRLATSVGDDLSPFDILMMERALRLAREAADRDEVPVGAVIYRGETIIAEAANNREASKDPAGHAELLAISEAGRKLGQWRLNDCTLACTLEPCPMCAGAMVNARLGRLIYGTHDPKGGAVDSLYELLTDGKLNHRVEVVRGVLAEPCAEVLRTFFQRRRDEKRAARTRCTCTKKSA